jgi:hypothetical protein
MPVSSFRWSGCQLAIPIYGILRGPPRLRNRRADRTGVGPLSACARRTHGRRPWVPLFPSPLEAPEAGVASAAKLTGTGSVLSRSRAEEHHSNVSPIGVSSASPPSLLLAQLLPLRRRHDASSSFSWIACAASAWLLTSQASLRSSLFHLPRRYVLLRGGSPEFLPTSGYL